MSPQEYINPWRLWVGSFVPNWLMEQPEVSPGAKLLYSRLAQHAGEKGQCYPGQDTLAGELAISERQVRRLLAELEGRGLIEEHRRGLNRTNVYRFPWHPWMKAAKALGRPRNDDRRIGNRRHHCPVERTNPSTPERTHMSGPEWTSAATSDRTDSAGHDRTPTSAPIEEENPRRESRTTTARGACAEEGELRSLAQSSCDELSEDQVRAVALMVSVTFRRDDAISLVVENRASFAQVASAIRLAQQLQRAGKLRGSFRGCIRTALERGDAPEPDPASAGVRLVAVREQAIEARRRESRAQRELVEREHHERECDLGRLSPTEFDELRQETLRLCPEPIRRSVAASGNENSLMLRIEMHRLFKQRNEAATERT